MNNNTPQHSPIHHTSPFYVEIWPKNKAFAIKGSVVQPVALNIHDESHMYHSFGIAQPPT